MDSNVWLSAIRFLPALLYYLIYPILLLLWGIWALLGILLAPFVHFGLAILYVVGTPFRLLAKFEPVYYFLGWALLVGGASGLFLCVTHRSIGHALRLTDNPKRAPRRFKRFQSRDLIQKSEEQSDSATTGTSEGQIDNQWLNGKRSNRFTLSDLYADWIDPDDSVPSKDAGLISTTIIEEEDDNQEFW